MNGKYKKFCGKEICASGLTFPKHFKHTHNALAHMLQWVIKQIHVHTHMHKYLHKYMYLYTFSTISSLRHNWKCEITSWWPVRFAGYNYVDRCVCVCVYAHGFLFAENFFFAFFLVEAEGCWRLLNICCKHNANIAINLKVSCKVEKYICVCVNSLFSICCCIPRKMHFRVT